MTAESFRAHPGFVGMFSTAEAAGAWPNNTRVAKVAFEQGDRHQIGTRATVLGSIAHQGKLMYFVEWDPMPGYAVGVMQWKIAPLMS